MRDCAALDADYHLMIVKVISWTVSNGRIYSRARQANQVASGRRTFAFLSGRLRHPRRMLALLDLDPVLLTTAAIWSIVMPTPRN
jgi:hypothetical protein